MELESTDRALASAYRVRQRSGNTVRKRLSKRDKAAIMAAPVTRLSTTNETIEYLSQPEARRGTVLYLAYGSNLSNETFRGNRGIKPLSQVNVQIPSLRLTFDLPGLAYAEPCFANTGRRDPNNDPPRKDAQEGLDEKAPLLGGRSGGRRYRKDDWHKGLVGVVYEVTPGDYAHIIATEGGGSSYHDILVDCHPFESSDPTVPVPQNPTTPAFRAHTLFAPATPSGENPPKDGGRFQRPNISYAQASARYLKLLTDGADECGLPNEYQEYLHALRPYTMTSNKQRLGQFIYLSLWMPFIVMVFAMSRMFADEKGVQPDWLKQLTAAIFKASWGSYDGFFKPLFGDGERSIPDGGDEAPEDDDIVQAKAKAKGSTHTDHLPDLEKAAHVAP